MVGVMRAYLTLFVKTYAAAAVLTLIFTFLLFWAQQGNAGAFLTVTLVMLIFGSELLQLLGGRGEVLARAVGYVQIFFGGCRG